MSIAQRQSDPRLHRVGIAFVILSSAFMTCEFAAGFGKKVVEAARKVPSDSSGPPELTGSVACTMMR